VTRKDEIEEEEELEHGSIFVDAWIRTRGCSVDARVASLLLLLLFKSLVSSSILRRGRLFPAVDDEVEATESHTRDEYLFVELPVVVEIIWEFR
jgi:hypothetical protein